MVRVIFHERQEVKNARKTIYEAGEPGYDLPEASVQYWENIGCVVRVPVEVAAEKETNNELPLNNNSSAVARLEPAGKKKFNVIDATGAKVNERPLTEEEANALLTTIVGGHEEQADQNQGNAQDDKQE